MVMETDAYTRWRKEEIGATAALMKILSSRHISINSNEGDWRPSALLFSRRSLLAAVPPLAHVLRGWTGLSGGACSSGVFAAG